MESTPVKVPNFSLNLTNSSAARSLYSTDSGYAVSVENDFGGASNTALAGTLKTVPYTYTKLGSSNVKAAVVGVAGGTLSF